MNVFIKLTVPKRVYNKLYILLVLNYIILCPSSQRLTILTIETNKYRTVVCDVKLSVRVFWSSTSIQYILDSHRLVRQLERREFESTRVKDHLNKRNVFFIRFRNCRSEEKSIACPTLDDAGGQHIRPWH